MPQLRVGTSGWVYDQWRASFYPPGLPQRAVLAYASRQFNSLELNGSFYSLQRPSSYQSWYAQTPCDFVFAVKGSRYITHFRRLRDAETPLANFLASGVLRLGPRLGPILWQLPPRARFGFSAGRPAASSALPRAATAGPRRLRASAARHPRPSATRRQPRSA